MKTKILLFILFTSWVRLEAQNLVPNPSFENYTVCPNDYLMLPSDWYTSSGTPDYFNACDVTNTFGVPSNGFGFQNAFDGMGYCGFYSMTYPNSAPPFPYKEYLGCHLISPLQIGMKYFVSFYVNYADAASIKMATNNIGILFSTTSYQDYYPYDSIWAIPTNNFANIVDTNIITDTLNWTKISGSIIANEAYQYIIIGNFFDLAHTDTLFSHNPIWLNQVAYYFLDKVCISTDSLTCNSSDIIYELNETNNIINISPNPVCSYLHISVESTHYFGIEIFNSIGMRILQSAIFSDIADIDLTQYSKGIYFIQILTSNKIINKKIIIN